MELTQAVHTHVMDRRTLWQNVVIHLDALVLPEIQQLELGVKVCQAFITIV